MGTDASQRTADRVAQALTENHVAPVQQTLHAVIDPLKAASSLHASWYGALMEREDFE